MSNEYGFSTRAITAGQAFDPTTGAVVPPVYLTTTFVQDGIGGFRNGYEYARGGNPTRDSLQELLASLEGGTKAFSFASGLAAEDAVLRALLAPGRPRAHGQRRLRRNPPPRQPRLRAVGRLDQHGRLQRPRRGARARSARTPPRCCGSRPRATRS